MLFEDDQNDINHKWFYELLISNNFIEEALNIKNKSHSNYGINSESLFIHIAVIFDKLIKNLSNFLKKNNILIKVENFYKKEIKNYIERMNKSIYEINNSFNISQILSKDTENELKVDEITEPRDSGTNNIKSTNCIFDLTETSFIKKNSKDIMSLSQIDKFFGNEDDENSNKHNLEKK